MVYTLRFFLPSKCSLFHNFNVFGSCIIHILYTGVLKLKKNNSGAKRLIYDFLWPCGPRLSRTSSFTRFLDHTQRNTTVGRTTLDERSARRRDLYLTTHNIQKRQAAKPPAGFELTIQAGRKLKS